MATNGTTHLLGGQDQWQRRQLTPTQQEELTSVQEHDIAIVINSTSGDNRLLYITNLYYYHPGVDPPHITVLDVPCYSPECFIHYSNHGTAYYQRKALEQPNRTYYCINSFLSAGSRIILRPTTEELREWIYPDGCGYMHCLEGIARTTPQTIHDLGIPFLRSRWREPSWTLCPYCMGRTLFNAHEALLLGRQNPRPGDVYLELSHMRAVNARRSHLGYAPLALEDLDHQPNLSLLPPPPPHAETPGVREAHTRRTSWYRESGNYDLEQCTICLVDFGDDQTGLELITELPCKHIYHRDCIGTWAEEIARAVQVQPTCPLRCPGTVIL